MSLWALEGVTPGGGRITVVLGNILETKIFHLCTPLRCRSETLTIQYPVYIILLTTAT